MSSQYVYDKDNVRFKKVKTSVWAILKRGFTIFIASVSMAVLYYIIFAQFVSTEQERSLKRENRMYEQELPALEARERLLSDVVEGLQMRDNKIYEEIFHTSAPNMDPGSSLDFLVGLDSIPDGDIVKRSEVRLAALNDQAADVEEDFRRIIELVQSRGCVMPPMSNPLKDFSFAQTGASVGDKINLLNFCVFANAF